MVFEITYVSGEYYDEKQKKRVEKVKSFKQTADSMDEAVLEFTMVIKKKIINITEAVDNTLGTNFPELGELLKKMKE